jgi:hypothetical protein
MSWIGVALLAVRFNLLHFSFMIYCRKMCMACKCRRDEHDVKVEGIDPGHIRIGRLFDHLPNRPLWSVAGASNGQQQLVRNDCSNCYSYYLLQSHTNSHGKAPPPVAPRPRRPNINNTPDDGKAHKYGSETDDTETIQSPPIIDDVAVVQHRAAQAAMKEDVTLKQYSWIPDGVHPRMVRLVVHVPLFDFILGSQIFCRIG